MAALNGGGLQPFLPPTRTRNTDRSYLSGTLNGMPVFAKIWDPLRIEREHDFLAALDHPGIVHCHGWQPLADGRAALILHQSAGVAVENWNTPLTAAQLRLIELKLTSAVEYLYDKFCFHADINESNVLLTADLEPLLIDFEFAGHFSVRADFMHSADYSGEFGPDFASLQPAPGMHEFPGGRPYPYGVQYVLRKLCAASAAAGGAQC